MIRVVLVLCCLAIIVEGRWHDLSSLKRQRSSRIDDDDNTSLDYEYRRHLEDESTELDTSPTPRRQLNDEPTEEQHLAARHRLAHSRKHHHARHRGARHHKKPTLEELNQETSLHLEYDEVGLDLMPRDKRHQRRRNWTEDDWKAFESSRRPELYDHDIHVFELEVREAQNSSLCNYTVVSIPDPGDRVPRVLEHIKCNYVGNRCRERGSYCCVQTYRMVDVSYEATGSNDTIKVYSGCVCALQIYGTLKPYNPKLPLDD